MYQPFLGTICYFGFDFAPRGWAFCTGSLLPVNQNQALFALLGTTYGGNGIQTFGLPDLRGRTIAGWGPNNSMGEMAGTENTTILQPQMPLHTHTGSVKIGVSAAAGASPDPTRGYLAQPDNRGQMYASTAQQGVSAGAPQVSVALAGGSQPFSILSPYLALNACIAISGLFPSRN